MPRAIEKSDYNPVKNPQAPATESPSVDAKLHPKDSDTFEPASAATKIQAWVRGHQVRKAVVLPDEVRNFLRTELGDLRTEDNQAIDIDIVALGVCREIQRLQQDKTFDKNERLEIGKSYLLPTFEGHQYKGPKTVSLPVGAWTRMGRQPTGKTIQIELIGQKLGEGTFKVVHASKPLQFELTTPNHEKIVADLVVARAKKNCSQKILEALVFMRRFFSAEELADPNFRLAGLLSLTERVHNAEIEARDSRCLGDLYALTPTLSFRRVLTILSDVAYSLSKFHAKGLVHCDVKPSNLLVGNDGRGYLSDFDLICDQGGGGRGEKYEFWDALAQFGYVTPFSDIYGLAQSTAFAVFRERFSPHFVSNVNRKINAQIESLFTKTPIKNQLDSLFFFEATAKSNMYALKDYLDIPALHPQMAKIKRMIQLLDAIDCVMKTNEVIVAEVDFSIYEDLNEPGGERCAVDRLKSQFPQYDAFVKTLIRLTQEAMQD